MPQMCSTLSTSAWISLLIRIVEGHQSFNAITLQRQVRYNDCVECASLAGDDIFYFGGSVEKNLMRENHRKVNLPINVCS